jgi:hypothetical protein
MLAVIETGGKKDTLRGISVTMKDSQYNDSNGLSARRRLYLASPKPRRNFDPCRILRAAHAATITPRHSPNPIRAVPGTSQ